MRTFRSILFVPAHRAGWAEKGAASGADAVLLDLEDAVPEDAKDRARTMAAEAVTVLRQQHPTVGIMVRPNGLDTEHHARDVLALAGCAPDAFLLPMVRSAADVLAFDALITAAEIEAGIPRRTVQVVPSLETAESVRNCEELACAPRVATLQAAAADGADIERALGFTWTPEGMETLYLRSRVVVAARSSGVDRPLVGVWQELRDLDGLRAFARQNRGLGFGGQLIIHPSHAEVVNREYGLSAEEAGRLRRLVEAFDTAHAAGRAAVDFEGDHIDIAHARHARELLGAIDDTKGDRP